MPDVTTASALSASGEVLRNPASESPFQSWPLAALIGPSNCGSSVLASDASDAALRGADAEGRVARDAQEPAARRDGAAHEELRRGVLVDVEGVGEGAVALAPVGRGLVQRGQQTREDRVVARQDVEQEADGVQRPGHEGRVAGDHAAHAGRPAAVLAVHALDLAAQADLGRRVAQPVGGLLDGLARRVDDALGHQRVALERPTEHRRLDLGLDVAVEGVEDELRPRAPSVGDMLGTGRPAQRLKRAGNSSELVARELLDGRVHVVAVGQRVVAACNRRHPGLERSLGVLGLELLQRTASQVP
jgi:hypothetical protein